jgi:hypothetical protein
MRDHALGLHSFMTADLLIVRAFTAREDGRKAMKAEAKNPAYVS